MDSSKVAVAEDGLSSLLELAWLPFLRPLEPLEGEVSSKLSLSSLSGTKTGNRMVAMGTGSGPEAAAAIMSGSLNAGGRKLDMSPDGRIPLLGLEAAANGMNGTLLLLILLALVPLPSSGTNGADPAKGDDDPEGGADPAKGDDDPEGGADPDKMLLAVPMSASSINLSAILSNLDAGIFISLLKISGVDNLAEGVDSEVTKSVRLFAIELVEVKSVDGSGSLADVAMSPLD